MIISFLDKERVVENRADDKNVSGKSSKMTSASNKSTGLRKFNDCGKTAGRNIGHRFFPSFKSSVMTSIFQLSSSRFKQTIGFHLKKGKDGKWMTITIQYSTAYIKP